MIYEKHAPNRGGPVQHSVDRGWVGWEAAQSPIVRPCPLAWRPPRPPHSWPPRYGPQQPNSTGVGPCWRRRARCKGGLRLGSGGQEDVVLALRAGKLANRPVATGSSQVAEVLPPNGIGHTTGRGAKQRKPSALNQRVRGDVRPRQPDLCQVPQRSVKNAASLGRISTTTGPEALLLSMMSLVERLLSLAQ